LADVLNSVQLGHLGPESATGDFQSAGTDIQLRMCQDRYTRQIPRGLPDADAEENDLGPEGT